MTGDRPGAETDRHLVRRRAVLELSALSLTAALAGCSSGDGDSSDSEPETCQEQAPSDLSGPVPETYREATAQVEDYTRNPDELMSKETADYQHEPKFGNKCETCAKFVLDRNDDCLGACVRVEGLIEPWGWCENYQDASGVSW